MPARRLALAAAGTVLLASGASACGGSGHSNGVVSAHSICLGSARDAIARVLSVRPHSISAAKSRGNNGAPQCTFVAKPAGGARVEVIANVQPTQSAYFVLERTIVEAAQVFAPAKPGPPPVSVLGLG